ncbi:MAG: SPOR domain-containing protein [Leptospira sp.]|nr:SPOR domain-containing protein [Leptospira sp.]
MKERTFYVINLDNKRIGIIMTMLIVGMCSFFLLGLSVGKRKNMNSNGPATEEVAQPEMQKYELPSAGLTETPEKAETAIKLAPEKNPVSRKNAELVDLEKLDENKDKFSKDKIQSSFPGSTNEEMPRIKSKKTARAKKDKDSGKDQAAVTPGTNQQFFTIQLAAFTKREKALKFLKKIRKDNIGKNMNPYLHKEADLYYVRIGKSETKKDMVRLLGRLTPSLQTSAMIVRNHKA